MRKLTGLICFLLTALTAMSAVPLAGVWNGKLDLGAAQLTLVLRISDEEPPVVILDSPDQGAEGIPTDVKYLSADSIAIQIPQLGVTYNAALQQASLIGTFTQMGYKLPLTLNRGEQLRLRPQTPQPPFDYDTQEVSFPSIDQDVTLNGTLTLPQGVTKDTPVVVMVTGSGLQNRDEELFGHKPFAVIADYLANTGIASLRYDDRGYGGSDEAAENATTLDFANDAEGAIRFLRGMGYTKVGVLGHSEGGTIAFITAAESEPVLRPDFLVTIGAPTLDGKDILLDQLRTVKPDVTDTEEHVLIERAETVGSPWMQYFVKFDPAAVITKAINLPVLAIYGSKDTQVRPAINEPVMHRLLESNPNCQIVVLDGLNHLLQPADTGSIDEYSSISTTIAPVALELIAAFVRNLYSLSKK